MRYIAQTTYALGWSHKDPQNKFRLAVGSFKEEYSNQVFNEIKSFP